MDVQDAQTVIMEALFKAEEKFTKFPTDSIHAAAIVVEEAGELQRAALQFTYENGSIEELKKEALHTAAVGLRFLLHVDKMKARKSGMKGRQK